ncbi:MAG: IS66 family transposase, partial [Thermoplasmata archaeon]
TELVPAYLFVLRILVHRYWCRRCHHDVQGTTDQALPGRQLGPRLASTMVLLSMMGLPVRRIQEVLATMAGLSVSVGEVQGLLEHSAEQLGPECDAIREEVRGAHLVQPDETSMRVGGANWWAWSFASELAAYYELDPSRGQDVVERVLGRDFPGTVVSDDWCAYNCLGGKRGVCWIHINRHLQAAEVAHGIRPRGPRDLSPPTYERRGHPPTTFLRFAHRLRALLRETVEWSEKAPASMLPTRERRARAYERRVRRLCDPDSKDEDVARISRNLLKRMPHLFEFVRDARIPWHNNAGERAIRSICVKRKMSGGMRSAMGARAYARLKSVHETVRRKGQDFLRVVMEALTRIVSGQTPRAASTA